MSTSFRPCPMTPVISTNTMSKAKKALSIAASVAATAILIRTFVKDSHLRSAVSALLSKVSPSPSASASDLTIVIEQSSDGRKSNEIYAASEAYLGSIAPPSACRLRVNKNETDSNMIVTVDSGEQVVESFEGVEFRWLLTTRKSSPESPEVRVIELSFDKSHKDVALGQYLPHVVSRWWAIKEGERALKLHMLRYETWYSVDLDHPATFNTLAMEPHLKREVLEDLERFVGSREHYRRMGKPWKRGYLIYGPQGSGKSSLVAAMANYLKFDVYDLDLDEVPNASVLRTVLAATTNRSILVVEDVDCHAQHAETEREVEEESMVEYGEGVTLADVMSSIEGLWSSSGEERIVVFTAEQKEHVDPAVLRPGRLDMYVHMSYCTPRGFRTLVANYHGIDDHPALTAIERLLLEVEATPAEVAAELTRGEDLDAVLANLVKFLEEKKGDPILRVL